MKYGAVRKFGRQMCVVHTGFVVNAQAKRLYEARVNALRASSFVQE